MPSDNDMLVVQELANLSLLSEALTKAREEALAEAEAVAHTGPDVGVLTDQIAESAIGLGMIYHNLKAPLLKANSTPPSISARLRGIKAQVVEVRLIGYELEVASDKWHPHYFSTPHEGYIHYVGVSINGELWSTREHRAYYSFWRGLMSIMTTCSELEWRPSSAKNKRSQFMPYSYIPPDQPVLQQAKNYILGEPPASSTPLQPLDLQNWQPVFLEQGMRNALSHARLDMEQELGQLKPVR